MHESRLRVASEAFHPRSGVLPLQAAVTAPNERLCLLDLALLAASSAARRQPGRIHDVGSSRQATTDPQTRQYYVGPQW